MEQNFVTDTVCLVDTIADDASKVYLNMTHQGEAWISRRDSVYLN